MFLWQQFLGQALLLLFREHLYEKMDEGIYHHQHTIRVINSSFVQACPEFLVPFSLDYNKPEALRNGDWVIT